MLLVLPIVINTMRRAASLILLLIAATAAIDALEIDPERVAIHAQTVRGFLPRPEASPGELALVEYISSVAEAAGHETTILDFSGFDEAHSFSSVVVVGTGPAALTRPQIDAALLIAVPLNTRDEAPADADRAASLAAVIAAMERASSNTNDRVSITFLFLGAEFGPDPSYPLGSIRFLSGYFPEDPHALLYLDADNLPLLLDAGGDGVVAPSWLIERTLLAAESSGIEATILPTRTQLQRLGVEDGTTQIDPFLVSGIPAVAIGNGDLGVSAPDLEATPLALARFLDRWVEEFASATGTGVPPIWDKHFLLFRLGPRILVIGERVFLGILLGLLLSTLLYSLLLRRQFARYIRTVGRNIWNLPVLYLLMFGFLSAATYSLELLILVRGFPTVWHYYPGAYMAFKLALAFFLFSVAAQLIRHLPLSKNGSFYSAASLFVLLVDIVLFSIINLSIGFYFMWAYFFAFLFSVVRSRFLKAICLIVSPILLARVAIDVLRGPSLEVTELLLLSTRGDLLLAFMLLPFLLMMIRLDYLVRHPVRGRRSFALGMTSVVSGVVVGAIVAFLLLSTPFGPSEPQPITVVETVDYPELERRLTIRSPAPIGDAEVTFAGQTYALEAVDLSTTLVTNRLPDVLSARLTYSEFLDRDRGQLVITAPQPVDDLRIRFVSQEPMIIYDASFPITVAPDQLGAEILIGRRPELPLTVDFTLGGDVTPSVEIEATSFVHPDPLEVLAPGTAVTTSLRVRSRLGR